MAISLTTSQRALLLQMLEEARERAPESKPKPFDPLPLCHAGQREAVADTARTQAWVTSRRAGKTTGAAFKLLSTASSSPDVNVLYLNTTIKRAINTMWDELLRVSRENSMGGIPNHSRHFLRLPNGSKVWISGCETKAEANALRGVLPRTALVVMDEGQDWKDELITYTYGDVVIPSLADVGGRFVLAGTPGSPRGFFYDFTRAEGVSLHGWKIWGNPHILDATGLMREAMRVRGCDETDPSIRREFFGEFCLDTKRQIFPYDDVRNGYDELPAGPWSYVVAADFGTVDACAVVTWGFTPTSPDRWVIRIARQAGLSSSGQAEMVRQEVSKAGKGVLCTIGDPGGGGKGLIVGLRQEHWIAMEPAEKTQKAAACIVMRDGFRTGRIRVPRSEREFINDLTSVEWDPDAVGSVIKGHMPDAVDAALYGYRKLATIHHYEPPKPQLTMEEKMWADMERQQAADDKMRKRLRIM